MGGEPTAKGVVLVAAREYVRRVYDAGALDRCLGTLPDSDAAEVRSVVPIGTYPLELLVRLLRAIDTECGAGDLAECRAVGSFSADWSFNMFHKVFLRFKTPDWFLGRAEKLWSTYYDTGRLEILPHTENTMAGRLHDFGSADLALCFRLDGWLERLGSMTGAPNVRVEHVACRSRGDDYCEFRGAW